MYLDGDSDCSLQEIVEVDYQPDCPVCLQVAFYPVKLPCGHIFCFLCIKGVALRSRKCAICRQAITAEYFDKPVLVKVSDQIQTTKIDLKENTTQELTENEYLWYYEGRNGWWQYDDKTSKEIETSFKSGKRSCTLLIAGFLYLIDFENMFQMRRNEPGRRRRIKRDKCDIESKGIAGIRKPQPPPNSTTDPANQSTNQSRAPVDGASTKNDNQGGASSSSPVSGSQDNSSVDDLSESMESTTLTQ